VIFPIRASTHGPFIDHLLSPQLQLPEGQHLSMYWPYLSLDNFMLETFYELPRVQNVNQLPSILAKATGPGLNILYADSEDHIAWYVLGKILKRQNHVNPLALLDGSQKSNDPLGFYSFEHNPFSVDPESGVIVSANHYPYTKNIKTPKLWGMWQGPERYERIGELLNTKEKWDLEELKNVQTDEVLADGPNILAKLLPRLEKNLKLDDKDKTIIELLKNWKGENKSKLAAPLIFWQWMYFLSAEVFADELGVNLSTYQDLPVSWAAIKQLIDKEESPVWDNMKTEERETMDVDISQSYKKMKEKLSLLGSNPSSWRWGFKHKLTFLHPLGREKTLAWLFNVGPYEVGGGNFEVSHMKFFRSKDDFSVFHGPSTRRLIDFSHPEESWGILPSGNSGHLMSAHYMDQAKDFIIGKYRPMLLDGEKIDAYKEGEVVFAP